MQPNLNIPLYLLAADERRNKVLVEVNRPTSSRLIPPLAEVVRYVSFSNPKSRFDEVRTLLPYLKPEFLDELSEGCQLDEP